MGLNQTVEIGKDVKKLNNWGQEFFSGINHLAAEEKLLLDNRQRELEKNIAELRSEIAALLKATDILDKEVEKITVDPVISVSEYQVNFLGRIKNFIANFRKNISEASLWLDSFTGKKKKRNLFWNNVKNKKAGGEQYLFSNEHSAARSGSWCCIISLLWVCGSVVERLIDIEEAEGPIPSRLTYVFQKHNFYLWTYYIAQ